MKNNTSSFSRLMQYGKQRYLVFFLIGYVIISFFTIVCFNGTGGAGDSITHYLYAKYAFLHPENFFNHWAKPVYVLLASPFAQFGFTGIKIFNATVTFFTLLFTYKTAKLLSMKNSAMAPVLLFFSPFFYILTYSGLTEPLFALFTVLGVFLILKHKYISAAVIISFLPFVRSEGLIIAGIFLFYFMIRKKWKTIPFLFIGHVVYSIAGYFVYHDLLWVFDRIPYARMSSVYGSGKPFHFVVQMLYISGIPIYVLFWIGFLGIIVAAATKRVNRELLLLVFLGFLAYFTAHSLFWYFGIFNSMGLKRVLVAVMPLAALIALYGYNILTEEIVKKRKLKQTIKVLLILSVLLFPFTHNPAAVHWKRDMNLSTDQKTAKETVICIQNKVGTDHRFLFSHPYLSVVLRLDYFDPNKRVALTRKSITRAKSGDIVIWENWFAPVENGVSEAFVKSNRRLKQICKKKKKGPNREIKYVVFKVEE